MSITIIKQSCDQIALIESALYGTGCMARIAPVGTNTRVFEVQKEFKPVVFTNDYELQCKQGFVPVRLSFHYNQNDNRGEIITNRKGIERLQELMPDTFGQIKDGIDEVEIEVKPYTKFKPA
ncbi:MAG: hypothetical protein WC516_08745 [Patescibacteria group bacterium]|jgi:hypothetical protein